MKKYLMFFVVFLCIDNVMAWESQPPYIDPATVSSNSSAITDLQTSSNSVNATLSTYGTKLTDFATSSASVNATLATYGTKLTVIASSIPVIQSEANTGEYTIVFGSWCETNDEGFEFSRSSYNIIDIRARRIDTNATAMAFSFKRINGNDLGNGALSIAGNDIQSNIVISTNAVAQDMGVRIKVLTGRSDQPVAVTVRYRKLNGQGQ